MRIVVLSTNHQPHQIHTIKDLKNLKNTEVFNFNLASSFHDADLLDESNLHYAKNLSAREILAAVEKIQPDLLITAGWSSKKFTWVSKKIKASLKIPVVVTSDSQWRNSMRQKINRSISQFHVLKAFSHIWVAGIYQYEYARQLGFSKDKIIFNSLSCDNSLFEKASIEHKKTNYPKNFIFVGRFVTEKGLDLLADAWKSITNKKDWTLTLIGQGDLGDLFKGQHDVIVKGFMNQEEIRSEFENAGCFILTSVFEPWAVVIHEAVSAGLPVIATKSCGSCPHFVVTNHNGYQTDVNSASIRDAMEKIIELDHNELIHYSENSRLLSYSINRELGLAQLLSIL